MARVAPEKAQFECHPRDQAPPRGQEGEGETYIMQHRQYHPDSRSDDNGQRKRKAKRPSYEGDPAERPSDVIRPCKTQGKRVASFWGLIWTSVLQGFMQVRFLGNMV